LVFKYYLNTGNFAIYIKVFKYCQLVFVTILAVIHCTDELKCMLCQDTLNGTIDQVLKSLMIVYGTGVYKGFCPLNYISKIPLFLPFADRLSVCLRRSLFCYKT